MERGAEGELPVKLSLFLLAVSSPFLYAQTNLPTPPNITMGADVLYDVQCRLCEREQKLATIAVKIVNSKAMLGGELQNFKGTFRCSKCGKEFTPPKLLQRWIRDPVRMAARPVAITNGAPPLPPAKTLKAPKHD